MSVADNERRYVLQTYRRPDFVLTHGEGMTVYDEAGNAYLDFGSGIAVTALGHAHPAVTAAVQEQAAQLGHVSNLYHTAPHAHLAKALCESSFADKVYFCNSGAEANEAAIKFARKFARKSFGPGKTQIVACRGSFHGRTVGALAITDREKYQAPFRPLLPDVAFIPFNDSDAAAQVIGPQTCAVFVEVVQGEGGVNPAKQAFVEALRDLCTRHGALLVIDEIQTGIGRTGRLWAYEHYGIMPDMVTSAKALGGGLPMGATLLTECVAETIEPGDHASTFAAGPVVSRAALVTLQEVGGMLGHIEKMGALLVERIQALESPHIKQVRGLGLMIGIQLDVPAAPVMQAGYEHGFLLLTAGADVLRLLPPLIVQEEHIEELVGFLREVLT